MTSIRNIFQVAVVAAAVSMSAPGWADEGLTGKLSNRGREQRSAQQADGGAQRTTQNRQDSRAARDEQSSRAGPQRSAPAAAPGASRDERSGIERLIGRQLQSREESPRQVRPTAGAAQVPPANGGQANANNRNGRDNDAGSRRDNGASTSNGRASDRGTDRGLTGGLIQREYQTSNDRGNDRNRDRDRDRDNGRSLDGNGNWERDNNANRDRDDRRNAWNDFERRDRERQWHRDNRPGRVVQRLPLGYRDYSWGGRRYYYSGGAWYQPYGGTYISVGIPYGMFVSSLPGAYSSFWFGSTRYYYSDYNYYTYEPARRGYVIVQSPYDDDYDNEPSRRDQDLIVYPAKGQSQQQQADDRYECHRWGASETNYDPLDDEYDADLREEYLRAMSACLTGRGYTVR